MARKTTSKQHPGGDIFTGALLFIVTGLMPLVVRLAVRPMPPELQAVLAMPEVYPDMFAYYKGWFLLLPVFAAVFYYVGDAATGGRPMPDVKAFVRQPPVIAALVYLLMALLSALFSDYAYTAWHGTYDRGESMIVQIAYIALFFITLRYARAPKYARPVVAGLIFSSVVMGAIGVGQFAGRDFFTTDLANILVAGAPDVFTPAFTIAYGTLFNPNTFGLYTAMLSSFLIIAGFAHGGRKVVGALLLLAGALMWVSLAGSRSLGGFMGLMGGGTATAAAYIGYLVRQKKRPSRAACVSVLTAAAVMAAAVVFVPGLRARAVTFAARVREAAGMEAVATRRAYVFEGDKLTFANADGTAWASVTYSQQGGRAVVRDGAGQAAAPVSVSENAEEEWTLCSYTISEENLDIRYYPTFFVCNGIYFSYVEGRLVPLMQTGAAIDVSEPVPAIGFKGREAWGTSRGYIWSRALPLLGKYLLLGSGPDSFINAFPQHDVVGKRYFLFNPYTVVDKAHNLYLQTGISTGGVSLLALVFLIGHYLTVTFITLTNYKGASRFVFGMRLGVFAAVAAFAVASLSTDSTIGSTGVFYVLLGLGYAANAWPTETTP